MFDLKYFSAVDEQNAQTEQQERMMRANSGSSADLIEPFNSNQCGLQSSPNSHSAPSFSIFTSDTPPKSPQHIKTAYKGKLSG